MLVTVVVLLLAGCGAGPRPGDASTAPAGAPPAPARLTPTAPVTLAPRPAPVRFSVLGDVGATADTSRVLSAIDARADDFTLVVGDLSYGAPGAETDWCRQVSSALGARYPVEIVSGNHEDHGPNGDVDAFARCLPNRLPGLVGQYGREWYVDVPAAKPVVRIVMVSPALDFGSGTWSYAAGTSHYRWTEKALTSARAAGIPWVVVGMHEPCLSVGVYACEPGPDLTDLMLREKVDLVVTGHEHMYQRTRPLALGAQCPRVVPGRYDAGCVTSGRGTTTITVGTGGHPLRDVTPGDPERPYFAAVSARDLNPAFGSLAVSVTAHDLRVRFEPVGGATFTDQVHLTR